MPIRTSFGRLSSGGPILCGRWSTLKTTTGDKSKNNFVDCDLLITQRSASCIGQIMYSNAHVDGRFKKGRDDVVGWDLMIR